LAEKAAWNFIEEMPADINLECVTINPGLIMGRPLIGGTFTSAGLIKGILSGQMPLPNIATGIVDVEDVA